MTHNKKQSQQLIAKLQQADDILWSIIQRSANIDIQEKSLEKQLQHMVINQKPAKEIKAEIRNEDNNIRSESFFDKIEDFTIDEHLENKVNNLKLNTFTPKRKEDVFKRYKKQQEEKITGNKRKAEKLYLTRSEPWKLNKEQFTLKNEILNKIQTFPITFDDMQKLRPETDLNDTIIGNYIKLLQFVFLPSEIDQKTHIFSSFFLQKVINQLVKEQMIADKDQYTLIELVREKVKQNYKNVKRWTRRVDIFSKQILVFPINAFRHWFCVLVINPKYLLEQSSQNKCELIFCDSMFDKREFVVQAIRKYLQHELEDKKKIVMEINQSNSPCYQLLLPRQTNTHDCGLYMISYIQELLLKHEQLIDLKIIENRRKLQLFPRTLILTMRQRLKRLFMKLINSKDDVDKEQALRQYKLQKQKIINEGQEFDYDQINQKQYKKYEKMNLPLISCTEANQKSFMCEIRFYLDPEVNFYEKDKI